jgi:hypothetical protein
MIFREIIKTIWQSEMGTSQVVNRAAARLTAAAVTLTEILNRHQLTGKWNQFKTSRS